MNNIHQLSLYVRKSVELFRRLPDKYQRAIAVSRVGSWLVDSKLQGKSLLLILLIWGANCTAQGLMMAKAFAQAADQPTLTAEAETTNHAARIRLLPEPFNHEIASRPPSLLRSMIEQERSRYKRTTPIFLATSSPDDDDGSRFAGDRHSPTVVSERTTISAMGSLIVYRPTEPTPAMPLEKIPPIDTKESTKTLDEKQSLDGLSFCLHSGSREWAEGLDLNRMKATQDGRQDLSADGYPSDLKPLLVVGVGHYSLPVSLHVPTFQSSTSAR